MNVLYRATIVAELRSKLEAVFHSNNGSKIGDKISLSSLLVAFWHATLACAVECEQFAIDQAAAYEQKHGVANAWQTGEFSQHLAQLYESRHDYTGDGEESKPAGEGVKCLPNGGNMNKQYMFVFLWMMRFETHWFEGLLYKTNYSQQILMRFEEALVPRHLWLQPRTVPVDDSLKEKFLRFIWHKITFGQSVVVNNSFAFLAHALIDGGSVVGWDDDWRVQEIFSVAGSCVSFTLAQQFSPQERVILTGAHAGTPCSFEKTWMAFLLYNPVLEMRVFIHCSLMSFDLHEQIFWRPLLPFVLIRPPTISRHVIATLGDKKLLAAEIAQFNVDKTVVAMVRSMRPTVITAQQRQSFAVADDEQYQFHQVDLIREVQPIQHRMLELLQSMFEAGNAVVLMRRELLRQCEKIRRDRRMTKAKQEKHMTALQAKTNGECSKIEHLRSNCVALYVLTLEMQRFLNHTTT
jgi:hypothetical protein